jgi:hypothetical protein
LRGSGRESLAEEVEAVTEDVESAAGIEGVGEFGEKAHFAALDVDYRVVTSHNEI